MPEQTIAERWGQAIRDQMSRVGKSVAELAEDVGVSRMAVYKWLDGSSVPTPDNQLRIADALTIHPRNLFQYPDLPRGTAA